MARVAPPDDMKRYLDEVGVFRAMAGKPVVLAAVPAPVRHVAVPGPALALAVRVAPAHVAPRVAARPAPTGGVPWWVWVPVAAAIAFGIATIAA